MGRSRRCRAQSYPRRRHRRRSSAMTGAKVSLRRSPRRATSVRPRNVGTPWSCSVAARWAARSCVDQPSTSVGAFGPTSRSVDASALRSTSSPALSAAPSTGPILENVPGPVGPSAPRTPGTRLRIISRRQTSVLRQEHQLGRLPVNRRTWPAGACLALRTVGGADAVRSCSLCGRTQVISAPVRGGVPRGRGDGSIVRRPCTVRAMAGPGSNTGPSRPCAMTRGDQPDLRSASGAGGAVRGSSDDLWTGSHRVGEAGVDRRAGAPVRAQLSAFDDRTRNDAPLR